MDKKDIASSYDEDMNLKFFKIRIKILKKLISRYKPKKVLEVGCGTGIFLDYFHNSFESAVGVDNCKPMIYFARKNHKRKNIKYIFSNDNPLPFKDNVFDMVLSMGVIEYVKDQKNHVEECLRVLKKNGILFLTTPTKSLVNIYDIIRKVGFAVERYWAINKYFSFKELHNMFNEEKTKIIEHKVMFFNPSNIRLFNLFFRFVDNVTPKKLNTYLFGPQYVILKKL